MNRTEKKCLIFVIGVHSALLGVLIFGSGFGSVPAQPDLDLQPITLIPPILVDAAGSGGGGGVPLVTPPTERPAPPHTVPSVPAPVPQPAPVHEQVQHEAAPVHHPRPQPPPEPEPKQVETATHVEHTVTRHQPTPDPQPDPEAGAELSMEPAKNKSTPKRNTHPKAEVKPTFTETTVGTSKSKKSSKPVVASFHTTLSSSTDDSGEADAHAAASAAAARRAAIQNSLDGLANGVKSSTSGPDISKNLEGVGGGDAFAGYRNLVYSAYYNAWVPPDEGVGTTSWPEAKITIGRDGSIRSCVLVHSSGSRALDRTVQEALVRVVKIAPFPAGAHDLERTYIIEFNLEAKKSSS